jgi:hypothetical protein
MCVSMYTYIHIYIYTHPCIGGITHRRLPLVKQRKKLYWWRRRRWWYGDGDDGDVHNKHTKIYSYIHRRSCTGKNWIAHPEDLIDWRSVNLGYILFYALNAPHFAEFYLIFSFSYFIQFSAFKHKIQANNAQFTFLHQRFICTSALIRPSF